MTGKIKKLVSDRGFGFIAVAGQEKDLFFHGKALVGVTFEELKEGDMLSFEMEETQKGPAAINVRLATAQASQTAQAPQAPQGPQE